MMTEDILPDGSAIVTLEVENIPHSVWMSHEEFLRWQEFCKTI